MRYGIYSSLDGNVETLLLFLLVKNGPYSLYFRPEWYLVVGTMRYCTVRFGTVLSCSVVQRPPLRRHNCFLPSYTRCASMPDV